MNRARVVTFGLGQDFIAAVADHVEESFLRQGRDLSRLGIVFGGRRPALFLKRELARRIGKDFFPPVFMTIDECVRDALSSVRTFTRLSDLDACYEIYRLTERLAPAVLENKRSFAQFVPWAREILTFIEHLDREQVSAQALLNVELKAHIGFDVPDTLNALLAAVGAVRAAFHGYMRERGEYSRGFMYHEAASSSCAPAGFDEILFCGFFYLSKTEQAFIRRLLEAQTATLFVQGDMRQWSVLAQAAEAFSTAIETPDENALPAPEISIRAGFDIHSEVCLVREALAEAADLTRTVVVVPESAHIMPLVSELGPSLQGANISMGYPLRRSALYSFFEAVSAAQETRKDGNYYTPRYLAALGNPLVKNLRILGSAASTRVLIHKIEEILKGVEKTPLAGCLFVSLSSIEESRALYDLAMATMKRMGGECSREELKAALRKLHDIVFARWEQCSAPGEFARSLGSTLDELVGLSSLDSFPLNVALCQAMFGVCDEFARARFRDERFERHELFRIFRDTLQREMVSFEGSPLEGLQILGLLETRSLGFDTVVVMDVNEAYLPKLKVYEPLIPREIMIHLGINHIEKEEEIQRYWFRRLLATAKSAVLIYQDNPDTEKSRFLEEMIWEQQQKAGALDAVRVKRAEFAIAAAQDTCGAGKTLPIVRFLKERTFSASSINTYLTCPLQFYFQYVLGLREQEDLLDAPEASDIGSFVHAVLEDAFRPYVGAKPDTGSAFAAACMKLLDERFRDTFERTMRPDSFLIKEVLHLRIGQFLENERRRSVERVLALEEQFERSLRVGRHDIRFTARVDRIDLCSGALLVLDYKTGSVGNLPETDPEKIAAAGFSREALRKSVKSFQLPLYLALLDAHPAYAGRPSNAALYPLREPPSDGSVLTLFRSKQELEHKSASMQAYLHALACLFDELFDPSIPFVPDDSNERTCSYCPFFSLCR